MKTLIGVMIASAAAVSTVDAATISLDPVATQTSLGTQITLNLDISGVNNGTIGPLASWDVFVTLSDPTLASLNATATTFGSTLAGIGGAGDSPAILPGAPGVTELNDTSLDFNIPDFASEPGSFTLATLVFDTLAPGTETFTLTVPSGGLSDADGNEIIATANGTSVEITTVPLPAGSGLLLSGLAALGLALRRGRSERAQEPQQLALLGI